MKPNLVLVAVAIIALTGRPLLAAWWAFCAGIAADVAAGNALGSTSLLLLAVAAGLSTVSAWLAGLRPAHAPAAVLVAALAAELLSRAGRDSALVTGHGASVWIGLASAFLSAALAASVVVLLSMRATRRRAVAGSAP